MKTWSNQTMQGTGAGDSPARKSTVNRGWLPSLAFYLRVCLERPPKRRVRARGLQEMAKITKPCRPGPLTGRLSKQALDAHLASMTRGACHTRGNGARPFRAAAPAGRLPSPLRSGRVG